MIYSNVKRLCAERKISLMRLEKELGFGNSTISKWSESSPSVDKLAKVASYFGVTVDELIRGSEGGVTQCG